MVLCIYIIAILFFLIKKRIRHSWLICSLVMCFLSITTKEYADLIGYTNVFDLAVYGRSNVLNIGDWPVLWIGICKIIGYMGLNYRGMVLVVIVFSNFLYHLSIKEYLKDEGVFWGLFLIFPGLLQIVQLRFFLGTAVVIFSIRFMLEKRKFWVIKYVALIVLATMIHSSCMIFLILPLADLLYKKDKIKLFLYIFIGAMILNISIDIIPVVASLFVDKVRMNRYFLVSNTSMPMLGTIKVVIVWSSLVLLLLYLSKIKSLYDVDRNITINSELIDKAFAIACMLGVSIPLLKFDSSFFRIIEIGYIISFIAISPYWKIMINCKHKITLKRQLLPLLALIPLLFFANYTYAPFDTVIKPLLSYDGFMSIFLQ